MVNELVKKAAISIMADATTVLSDLGIDTNTIRAFESRRYEVLKETVQVVTLSFPNGEEMKISWTRKDSEAKAPVAIEDEFHA